MNIFCLIHTKLHQYFFFILFYASSFLYAFPFSTFFRVIGLGCIHFSWNIKSAQSTSTCIGSIVMIYHFKTHVLEKHRAGLECYEVLGPKNPLPFIFSLMQGLTRPRVSVSLANPLSWNHPPPTLTHSHPLFVSQIIQFITSKLLQSQWGGYLMSVPFLNISEGMDCYQHKCQSILLSFVSCTIWKSKTQLDIEMFEQDIIWNF